MAGKMTMGKALKVYERSEADKRADRAGAKRIMAKANAGRKR